MLTEIDETCAYLRSKIKKVPSVAIILGSGLGPLAEEIDEEISLPYAEIPGFRQSTVEGHSGTLIFGKLCGVDVMAMKGRLHFYEGYSMKDVTFPERVMSRLGIKYLMVSNAAGGLNPEFVPGDIMIITDHINLFPEHPLRGKNIDELGVRFPDMSEAYNRNMIEIAERIAEKNGIKVRKGVYVGTQGPSFETPAEYRYFRRIGGDSVGMSTVPEVIVAHHAGMKCFGVSVIANVGIDAINSPVSHEEVLQNTMLAQKKLSTLFKEMVPSFA